MGAMRKSSVLGTLASFALSLAAAPGFAQTREYLDAPVVKSQIRVVWDPASKKLQYAADDGSVLRELPADKLFLTKTSLFVTYQRINPLRIQATASATASDDPTNAAITKLIEAIGNVGKVVAGPVTPVPSSSGPNAAVTVLDRPASTSGEVCKDEKLAAGEETLRRVFRADAAAIKHEIDGWIAAIDIEYANGATGQRAIGAGVAKIEKFIIGVKQAIPPAQAARDDVEAIPPSTTPACKEQRSTLRLKAQATVDDLTSLHTALISLHDMLLDRYVHNDFGWIDRINYKIGPEVGPTAERLQTVTVSASSVKLRLTPSGGEVVGSEPLTVAKMTVRRYSLFTPEIGVGAVFGFLKAPQYGTTTNEKNEVVVSRIRDDGVAVAPSVLVNFVCHCAAGPLAPMFQVGASTSKDVPAILAGGGLRLFGAGKGDISIGGGVMVGWVKDLQTRKEGDVVKGTSDIEADLGLRAKPKTAGYFVLQYKF
jgi:hypothetical protein